MNPSKRITKQQMKQDRLVSTAFMTTEYVQKNPKPFIIGGLIFVVALIAIVLLRYSSTNKNDEAQNIFIRSQMEAAMGQEDAALSDMNLLVSNYGGTSFARLSALTLANSNFNTGDYDKALEGFKKISNDYSSDNMMASIAATGMAACYEAKGDFANAGKYYKQAVSLYPDDNIWAPQHLLKAGINFAKAGDKKSAIEVYDEIEKKFSNSPEVNNARRLKAEISY